MKERMGKSYGSWNARVRGRCALDVDMRSRLRMERVVGCLLHGGAKNSRIIQMARHGQIDVE